MIPNAVSRRVLFCAGVLLLSGSGVSLNLHAAELCHRPPPQTLIAWYNHTHPQNPLHYDPKNSAIYHPISILRSQQPSAYWIGLAWLAPTSGALFAIECNGSVIDASPVGAIGKLSPGPVLPELGETVMPVYVSRESRDCVHDSIQIAALKDNKIMVVWQHGYNQGLNVTAQGKLKNFIAENYTLTAADGGLTLRLSGERATYAYLEDGSQASVPFKTQSLEAETWHWDAGKLRFVPEKAYRSSPACTPK
ncbi:MAG: hypothetical protein KGL98_05385 [Gammaproteobacteria bacterium]|nr:hypothetical protein [Gammaproteobacteria bacterium]